MLVIDLYSTLSRYTSTNSIIFCTYRCHYKYTDHNRSIIFDVYLFTISICRGEASTWQSAESILVQAIRGNISEEVRPVSAAANSIELQFSLSLVNIAKVDEKEQLFSVQAFLYHVSKRLSAITNLPEHNHNTIIILFILCCFTI